MSVKPENLDNAERDLELMNRASGKKVAAAVAPSAEDELKALRQRIAAALASPPEGAPIPECRACYRKGWMAALKALED
jgi:hypothetical protein